MSSQPRDRVWYAYTARMRPGASASVYSLRVTVWWTTSALGRMYATPPERSRSSAPHPCRVTTLPRRGSCHEVGGEEAEEEDGETRAPAPTKSIRTSDARPVIRNVTTDTAGSSQYGSVPGRPPS